MSKAFGDAMLKLSFIGQDKNKLVDCSEVIPQAKPLKTKAYIPGNLTVADIQKTVSLFDIHSKFYALNLHASALVPETFP
jgi:hypothetical protein